MLDFPASPTPGQKYPQPPVSGQPVYTWDGEKWTTVGGALDSGGAATATPLMDATPAVVGSSSKYAREDHKHPVDTAAVRTEQAQTLTVPQQLQARANIYAAPFDAMAYNGLQINGNCDVDQTLLGNVQVISASGEPYFVDMWTVNVGGAASVLASPYTDSPPNGYAQYPRIYNITVLASLAAADYAIMRTKIEGYRCARLQWGATSPQPITIGFWIRTPAGAPTVTLFVGNAANTRSYLVNVPATVNWVYQTVTIPGDSVVWPTTNGIGMYVGFCMGTGTAKQGVNATWNAGNFYGTAQTTNFLTAAANMLEICGLTVHPGTQGPGALAAPYIMRPYDQELITCQRYWRRLGGMATNDLQFSGYAVQGQWHSFTMLLAPTMRAAPTHTVVGTFQNVNVANQAFVPAPGSLAWQITPTATGSFSSYANVSSAYFTLDARL